MSIDDVSPQSTTSAASEPPASSVTPTDVDLTTQLPVDDHHLTALRDRLANAGQRWLEVSYTTIDSPAGALLLATTSQGLARVAFACQDFDRVVEQLADRLGWRILRAPAPLAQAHRQLDEYFDHRRKQFDLPLDHRLSSGFGASVHQYLPRIGFGERASYAEVAQAVGSPRAVRAVGTACAKNPLPIVVPCHRVVRSDGSAGQYAGGPEAKGLLLDLEAARSLT